MVVGRGIDYETAIRFAGSGDCSASRCTPAPPPRRWECTKTPGAPVSVGTNGTCGDPVRPLDLMRISCGRESSAIAGGGQVQGLPRSTSQQEHQPLAAAAGGAEFAAISRRGEDALGLNHTFAVYSLRCLDCSFYLICQGLQLHILLSVANKDEVVRKIERPGLRLLPEVGAVR